MPTRPVGVHEVTRFGRQTRRMRTGAAPLDDCGCIWGYVELVEVLRDPADQEHDYRLEWLGLDDAAEFDPDRFDADAVTRALCFAR